MEIRKKIRIGIDLDDTVWKFHEKLFEDYNKKNNTNFDMNDFLEYNFRNFVGIDKEREEKVFIEFIQEIMFNDLVLINNFLENFEKIKERYDVYFITARPYYVKDATMKNMLKFDLGDFPIYYRDNGDGSGVISKYERCKELGIDIMIDDAFHNLEECSKNGIKCFLLNNPWNRNKKLNENVIRVNDWNDIWEVLKDE